MATSSAPSRLTVALVLTVGILSVSTSAVFVRLALDASQQQGLGFSLVLAASRLTLASVALIPVWREFRPTELQRRSLLYSGAAGLLLAIHFASWITSLSYTSIAASTTLVTTNPIWITLLSWWIWRDRPSSMTCVGIGLAIAGSVCVGLSDQTGGSGTMPLLGNALALVGAWTVSGYFLLSREAQRTGVPTQHHIAIAYSVAALALLPLPIAAGSSYVGYPAIVYGYIALMALFPQLIGHTSLNWSVRWISPTLVTLAVLAEPVGAGILSAVLFQEYPGWTVLVGAVVLLCGVAIAALGNASQSSAS